jgi:curved DNA-binding protein CbpA
MEAAVHAASGRPEPTLCARQVLSTAPKGDKVECAFTDGTSILLSKFLVTFVHQGDQLQFRLGASDTPAELHIRPPEQDHFRRDILQVQLGYVTQPRKDKRGEFFVSAEPLGKQFGIHQVHLRCERLRDYFYVANRRCAWDKQPSFYELLRTAPDASPVELRLAFKMRTLELRAAQASTKYLAALERAFNILARPDLRACYDALLADPAAPVIFPNGGFGSLLVAGESSRDGSAFYASRILAFLPEQKRRRLRAPLRQFAFYDGHAVYRDPQRKVEVTFDQASLPLAWDPTWNQWKHLLGTKVSVQATLVQSGKYRYRSDSWQLTQWETALPSRLEVALPSNISEQISEAQSTYRRFGQFAPALDQIRSRIESAPVEREELQRLCAGLGIPGDFDVSLITWKPDYDAFYYKQLSKRARRLYLFQSEYVFDLENAVVVETPQLGHATYLFAKPENMSAFLSLYASATKDEIRHNHQNTAERLGFLGRLVHGVNPRVWLKELKLRLGEAVEYAEAID